MYIIVRIFQYDYSICSAWYLSSFTKTIIAVLPASYLKQLNILGKYPTKSAISMEGLLNLQYILALCVLPHRPCSRYVSAFATSLKHETLYLGSSSRSQTIWDIPEFSLRFYCFFESQSQVLKRRNTITARICSRWHHLSCTNVKENA